MFTHILFTPAQALHITLSHNEYVKYVKSSALKDLHFAGVNHL